MLKRWIILIMLFFISTSATKSFQVNCGYKNVYGKCIWGELCNCTVEECNEGNLLVFANNLTQPLCFPPIKDEKAIIHLELCGSGYKKINVIAICGDKTSQQKSIEILDEKPPSCIWNETASGCQQNPDPLADKCRNDYYCAKVDENSCACVKKTTTTLAKTSTTLLKTTVATTALTTTELATTELEATTPYRPSPCPYECCEGLKGYEDLKCEEGYVCCKSSTKEYYCKKGNTCAEQKRRGFGGLLVIVIFIALGIVGFAIYYMKKTKVNLVEKYKF
ncbi:MAG: hypothetical protein N3E38_02760 [Candidatus Aenigmarchaeota archaeon]|nr:hypothetical protein [Candidatus Aenigmarchaeota archaeon]